MVRIDQNKCISCLTCYNRCSEGLFDLDENGHVYVARPDECWLCATCEMDCPVGAIKVTLPPKKKYMVVSPKLIHDPLTEEEHEARKQKYIEIEKELVIENRNAEAAS